jgi:catechol 2,3-dioxygenase-like lactoylglutathione lyase family enzyme
MMKVLSLDHILLAMPPGGESRARDFYHGILGIPEVVKPSVLVKRGGAWFENGSLKIHLGVEKDFRPARKAHPAFVVKNLPGLIDQLRAKGFPISGDEPLAGYDRIFTEDPFGNRIELIEPHAT